MKFITWDLLHEKLGRNNKGGSRFCDAKGCTQTTREGKPYCPDHIEYNPYVANLIAELAKQEDEIERVRAKGLKAVNLDGQNTASLLQQLRHHGARTIERLARDTGIEEKVVRHFVGALKKRGIVTTFVSRRNSTMVKLVRAASAEDEDSDTPSD